MDSQTIQTMMSSDSMDWNTPQNILNVIYQFDKIRLDPCSNETSIVDAAIKIFPGCGLDGLEVTWSPSTEEKGVVYVNPPYGPAIKDWLFKCNSEANTGAEVIALVPARTDTKWWHTQVLSSDAICFWKGRLKFLGGKSCAPFPSAVLYWGPRYAKFAKLFRDHGMVVFPE